MDEILLCNNSSKTSSEVLPHGTIHLVQPYVVLTYASVDGILLCNNSNKTSSAVLSHGTIYFSMQF